MSVIYQAPTLTVSAGMLSAFDTIQNSIYGVSFNSTTVTLREAQSIANAARSYLATGSVNFTSPSGITVSGNAGSVSIAGTALTREQCMDFAMSVGHYVAAECYEVGPITSYSNQTA